MSWKAVASLISSFSVYYVCPGYRVRVYFIHSGFPLEASCLLPTARVSDSSSRKKKKRGGGEFFGLLLSSLVVLALSHSDMGQICIYDMVLAYIFYGRMCEAPQSGLVE